MALKTETRSSNRKAAALAENKDKLLSWADDVPSDGPAIKRRMHSVARIILICLREMKSNVLTLRAGYLTYAMLLSMVPILAMSTAVVKGLGGGDQLREVVYTYVESLENATPAEEGQAADSEGRTDLAGHLRSAVDKIFDYVDRTNFATLGTFGMIGIFFSVILVLGQVEKSLNVIWKVADGRSFVRKVADYMTLMVLMPISMNVALAAGTMLKSKALGGQLDSYLPIEWIQILLLKGVPILVLTLTLYLVYIFFPNTKTRGTPTMIGAFVAGTFWFITQNIYISMQIGVSKYNAIYGSFATIPLFLVWVWLGWLFVLIGAQLAYAIQKEPGYHFLTETPQPALQLSAAIDICRTVSGRFSSAQETRHEDLLDCHPDYPARLVEATIEKLVEAEILHHSQETGEILLSRAPEQISSRKLVEMVLGTHTPATAGGDKAALAVAGAAAAFAEDQPVTEPGNTGEAGEPAAEADSAQEKSGDGERN